MKLRACPVMMLWTGAPGDRQSVRAMQN